MVAANRSTSKLMNEAISPHTDAIVKACWSCHGPVHVGILFCPTCKAVQGPAALDHFQRLGLKIHFKISHNVLDQVYFDLQRQLHPDRFAGKSPKEKALSQQQATALNDAYETLKDDLRRADYMVHLQGTEVLSEGCNLVSDQSILIEAMEMREHLTTIDTMLELNILSKKTKTETDAIVEQIAKAFESNAIETAGRLTTRLKYLHKMMDEIRHVRAKLLA